MQLPKHSDSRLAPHEAEALWRAWTVRKDAAARDRLVLSYAPMVNYLASRKIRELPAHCEVDDLVSCGLMALVESVDRFDPAKGATFEQYAWTRVSGAIMDELRRQDWAPRSLRQFERDLNRTEKKLSGTDGAKAPEKEVAETLGMGVKELRNRRAELARVEMTSLSAPTRGADGPLPIELGETIQADAGEHDPSMALLARERTQQLREAIAALDDRERQVLSLVHVHRRSGAEIGAMLGVTESRVSQILGGIRKKLRAHLDAYEAAAPAGAAA